MVDLDLESSCPAVKHCIQSVRTLPPGTKIELPASVRPVWQEFKLHGIELQGPCADLLSAGCKGKFTSNIQRDILRKVDKHDPEQAWRVGNDCFKQTA